MEKLSENQTPDLLEIHKTLSGLGNVLIQAGLSDGINCRFYPAIGWITFSCGDFKYETDSDKPYNEEEYLSVVKSIEDFMKEKVKDYEKQIFALECSKAVMDVYLSEKK